MIEIYLKNDRRINGEWTYSPRDVYEDLLNEFVNDAVPH